MEALLLRFRKIFMVPSLQRSEICWLLMPSESERHECVLALRFVDAQYL